MTSASRIVTFGGGCRWSIKTAEGTWKWDLTLDPARAVGARVPPRSARR